MIFNIKHLENQKKKYGRNLSKNLKRFVLLILLFKIYFLRSICNFFYIFYNIYINIYTYTFKSIVLGV
jgi:hypothetical protein